ncbi:heavy-metal-associated domain-containing protein [Helicobacter cholecystus]|uniref:heavy-metal-associated domain-containing protein n=1 Tax=Helicobacter cholecystus TaxID=45498 RepID=UPI0027384206|nr:heavy-metal-associated domain-containing protein [Helicobacter cholecystus]
MNTLVLKVPQMNCSHCISKITKFLQEVQGVQEVECLLPSKEVKVTFCSPADKGQIIEAIEDCGFEVE